MISRNHRWETLFRNEVPCEIKLDRWSSELGRQRSVICEVEYQRFDLAVSHVLGVGVHHFSLAQGRAELLKRFIQLT